MEIYEIICGAIVLLLALLSIMLCLMQDDEVQDSVTSGLGGGSTESCYGQNEGNTREAALAKLTKILGIVAFVVIVAMNIIIPWIMTLTQSTAA